MDNLKHVREQGRMAAAHNKEHDGDTAHNVLSAYDCPYGPGDNRDAWLAGFGGQEEAIEQADTSKPSADDVRHVESETVRKGAKAKKGKEADATKVVVGTTGTAETALVTHVQPVDPTASDIVPTPDAVIGDPAASQGPNDANTMHSGAEPADAADAAKLM